MELKDIGIPTQKTTNTGAEESGISNDRWQELREKIGSKKFWIQDGWDTRSAFYLVLDSATPIIHYNYRSGNGYGTLYALCY